MNEQRNRGNRVAGRLAAAALVTAVTLTAAPQLAARDFTEAEFVTLPAAQAFRDGRYEEALEAFKALLETNPQSSLVLRYAGLAALRTGQAEAALGYFDRAVAAEPTSAAAHFNRAQALLTLNRRDEAVAALTRVTAEAPGSPYADQARTFLEGLGAATGEERAQTRATKTPSFLQAGVGLAYDDNVAAKATDEDEAFRAFEFLEGAHFFHEGQRTYLKGDGRGYLNHHTDDQDEFDLISVEGRLEGGMRGEIAGRPGLLAFGLLADYDHLDGERFATGFGADLTGAVGLSERVSAVLVQRVEDIDYEEDGVAPNFTSRDGVVYTTNARVYFLSADGKSFSWAGYLFEAVNANGQNFDREGHGVEIGGRLALTPRFRIDGHAEYREDDYDNFVGPIQRETDYLELEIGGAFKLTDRAELRGRYTFVDEDSSLDALDYDRNVFSLSVVYAFTGDAR